MPTPVGDNAMNFRLDALPPLIRPDTVDDDEAHHYFDSFVQATLFAIKICRTLIQYYFCNVTYLCINLCYRKGKSWMTNQCPQQEKFHLKPFNIQTTTPIVIVIAVLTCHFTMRAVISRRLNQRAPMQPEMAGILQYHLSMYQ